jgi:hypothetical protein
MKQTTIQFEKRKNEPVTIQRLQEAVDLISQGFILSHALHKVGLKGSMGKYLVDARILGRYDGKTVFVVKQKLERKDFYRIMELQKKYHQKKYSKRKAIISDNQKADTDMLGLVNMPKTEPIKLQRTPKPKVKNAIALPWWKRFLLYLLNH